MFIDTLDTTIISVAIPSIAANFGINPVGMKLALTCYLLSLAVFIPISGWIADRFGEKNVFIAAVTIFTVSSILCAASPNLHFLIGARTIQGFGGALMMPVGRLIMLRSYSKAEYAHAMSLVVIPGLIGPALGPALGGLILSIASWHWIFLVNVPFGIFEIIIAYHFIKPSARQTTPPFNWSGFLLFSFGLMLITFALALLGDDMIFLPYALICIGIASFFLAAYWKVSLNQAHPLLDMGLLNNKTFRIAVFVSLLARPGVASIPFLLPLLLQITWGKSALFSGLSFMFLALGMICARFIFNVKTVTRYGFKKVLLACILSFSFLSLNLCWFSVPNSSILLCILLFLIGIATSQFYMCIGLMSVLEIEPHKFSQATSIISTTQQFAAGCGIAIAAIILHVVSHATAMPLFSSTVFFWTFILLNCFSLLSLIFVFQLNRELKLPKTLHSKAET